MEKLTKKYRVVYDGNKIILNPFDEYSDESVTFVGKGRSSAEFDTLEESERFINENMLTYEFAEYNLL